MFYFEVKTIRIFQILLESKSEILLTKLPASSLLFKQGTAPHLFAIAWFRDRGISAPKYIH